MLPVIAIPILLYPVREVRLITIGGTSGSVGEDPPPPPPHVHKKNIENTKLNLFTLI